jgi:undecaprenyl-phosphate 4-deoxy-4-formamido-L-arabinose transferase
MLSGSKHKLSISGVVPVYNSRHSLEELVTRFKTTCVALGVPFELILVDDASTDGSSQLIEELSRHHFWLFGIQLMRNYGQHNSLLAGIRCARHTVTVTLDDDLQTPPEEIPRLLERIVTGADVVYGYPTQERHGFCRVLASRVTKLMLKSAMGIGTAEKVSAFRAFRTNLRDSFEDFNGSSVCIDVLLTWGTTRFDSVPVTHHPRLHGKSNYTLGRLLAHAINMTTGFSTAPLRLASLMGFFLTFFGMGILVYVVGRYFISGAIVPGFAFLASTLAIFSGAQLFALGIIGEYLARMHIRSMGHPPYKILSTTDENRLPIRAEAKAYLGLR